MALTSDQITAQNFKDFYGQIRPYLNGNSPLAVNTFNKSDIYDTTEKVVGRWIDGKPLYLKVLVLESNIPQNGWIPYPNNSIDILIDYGGTAYFRTERYKRPFPWSVEGNYANINSWNSNGLEYSTNSTNNVLMSGSMIWLIYTKTNDTQMSISDGNEYSTSEQLVGHWIDGKPLYQITVVQNLTLPLNSAQVNFGDLSGLHIDYGTVVELAFNEDNYWINQSDISIWLRKPNNSFGGRSTLANVSRNGTVYITLRYTKTTD